MNITLSVVVSWAFGVWWLICAARDYSYVTLNNRANGRYHKPLPACLAMGASVELALLGYWLSVGTRSLAFAALCAFGVTWIVWSCVAVAARPV